MRIGRKLRGGEVIELVGDLGAGKTTFVHGLARGAGSHDVVRSPSFTLNNRYRAADGRIIHHFDFYRLDEPGIVAEELAEALADPKAIVIVEWGDIARAVLPSEHMTIHIKPTSEAGRSLHFSCPSNLAYLLPENSQ
jgi:tRNA threonylcarbamoyladenosine biosynthesis protein TsaE